LRVTTYKTGGLLQKGKRYSRSSSIPQSGSRVLAPKRQQSRDHLAIDLLVSEAPTVRPKKPRDHGRAFDRSNAHSWSLGTGRDYERGFGIGAQHCGEAGSQVELARLAKS